MNKIVDEFLGLDPILGDQAKSKLINHGENSLDLIISRFGSFSRTQALETRLGELFGYFGNTSVDKLLAVLKTGEWHKMIDASYCFKNLPEKPAATGLGILLSASYDIDIKRCVIDAIGHLGAKSLDSILLDLFPEKNGALTLTNEGYYWQKLSYNVFMALLRISAKAEEEGSIFGFHRLANFEYIYEIAGDVKFHKLLQDGRWSGIFRDFKPVAADTIISKWLNHDIRAFQKMALSALKWMRLTRIEDVLRHYAEIQTDDEELKSEVAQVLAEIPSKKAAETVKYIFSIANTHSSHYESVCLSLAISLEHLDDKDFIEQTYPYLLGLGGEIAAHTYYNLGILGYDEGIWSSATKSPDYIVRSSVASIYARLKGGRGISILLQMERESSHDIEKLLIQAALIRAGHLDKKDSFRKMLSSIQKILDFGDFRYPWKMEIFLALQVIEKADSLSIWRKLFKIDNYFANQEMPITGISQKEGKQTKIINTVTTHTPPVTKPINIFISYSHEDEKWKDKLKSHLSALRNQGFLVDWDDRQIEAGQWDSQIEDAMNKADIFLLLITHNFISSKFITSREITRAYSKFKAKEAKIIPIICDSCSWQLQPVTDIEKEWHPTENRELFVWLGKFQSLPKNAKPIKNWKNQHNAMVEVIDELKRMM